MSLYLVERTLSLDRDPALPGLEDTLMGQPGRISGDLAQDGAVWIYSLITPDGKRSFCLYQGPNPETVRTAAALNGLPIDRINAVHIQSPSPETGAADELPECILGEAGRPLTNPAPTICSLPTISMAKQE